MSLNIKPKSHALQVLEMEELLYAELAEKWVVWDSAREIVMEEIRKKFDKQSISE